MLSCFVPGLPQSTFFVRPKERQPDPVSGRGACLPGRRYTTGRQHGRPKLVAGKCAHVSLT